MVGGSANDVVRWFFSVVFECWVICAVVRGFVARSCWADEFDGFVVDCAG